MSTFKKLKGSLGILAVSALLPLSANASEVSIRITAVVHDVYDTGNFLNGTINPGDTIVGHYVYDVNTPNTGSMPSVGDYWHTQPGQGMCLMVNGLRFRSDEQAPNFLIELVNNHGFRPSDNYVLHSYRNTFDLSVPDEPWRPAENHISWQLDDPSALALNNVLLTGAPPVLSDWQSWIGLGIDSYAGGGMFSIRAHVVTAELGTSECADPVEPAASRFIGVSQLIAGKNVREAVLVESDNGNLELTTKALTTGALVSKVNISAQESRPIALAGIRDVNNNNHPEVAIVYPQINDQAAIRIVDSFTGQFIRQIPVGDNLSRAIAVSVVDDLNRNNSNELSILSERPDGSAFTQIFDSRTGQQLFGNFYE